MIFDLISKIYWWFKLRKIKKEALADQALKEQSTKEMAEFIKKMGGKKWLERCKKENIYSMVELNWNNPLLPGFDIKLKNGKKGKK